MTNKFQKTKSVKKANHFDLLFKYAYSLPQFAKELFELVLSKEELMFFDWSTLRAEKDTFQGLRADAVFSAALMGYSEIRFRFCLLLEHKSQYSQKMFCQMLKYQTQIIDKSLEELGQAWPVLVVTVYNGKKPWSWANNFQAGLWGENLKRIPLSLRQDMLNFGPRVLDTHMQKVAEAIKSKRFKSRGVLNALKCAWDLKADEKELKELISLFDNWPGDRGDSLVLSLGNYLWSVTQGMNQVLWDRLEHSAVKDGIFTKGGYMDIKEYIREEGRQEGRQEERQVRDKQIVLNMLKNRLDTSLICKVTGLSQQEINKLKNGSLKA